MSDPLPFSDRALQAGDTDLLGRGNFVRNLATVLCNAPFGESIVFALYGKWGEGKTSTLTLLEQEFATREEKNEPSPLVIRFNPWVFSGREHLFNAFFEDIGNAIGSSQDPKLQDAAKKWKRLGAYSNLAGNAISGIDAALNLIGIALPGSRMAVEALKKIETILEAAAQADENTPPPSLVKIRGGLEETLLTLTHPILVILDDLDRLPPNELVEIFQLLKSTVDLPNVHYLLLCDRGNIERSLKKQKLHPDYLEKIVQFSAPLPSVPDSLLHRLLIDQLRIIFDDVAENDPRFDDNFWQQINSGDLPKVFSTLRDVKRFLGELRLALPIFCANGHFELNPEHFLILQALRLLHPRVVEKILSQRSLYVPRSPSLITYDEDIKRNSSARKLFVEEELPKSLKKQGHTFMASLLRDLLLSGGVDWTENDVATEARFLSSALWFDCYFTLDVPQKVVRIEDITAVVDSLANKPDDLALVLNPIISRSGFAALMRCLLTRLDSEMAEHGQRILVILLTTEDFLDEPHTQLSEEGLLNYFSQWVRQLPKSERQKRIIELIEQSRNHIFFVNILHSAENADVSQRGLFKSLTPIYSALCKSTAKLLENKAAADEPILYNGFWLSYEIWSKWGSRGKLRAWIKDQVQSDEGLKEFLLSLGDYRTSHDRRGNESDDFWLYHKYLETYPSLKDGLRRCRRLGEDAEDEKNKLLFKSAVIAFKDEAEWRRGKRVMFRKFPELPNLRVVGPQFINGHSDHCAIIFDRVGLTAVTAEACEEIKSQFDSLYDAPHTPMNTPIILSNLGGPSKYPAIHYVTSPDQAIKDGLKLEKDYVLVITHRTMVIAIGLHGEGRINLGAMERFHHP